MTWLQQMGIAMFMEGIHTVKVALIMAHWDMQAHSCEYVHTPDILPFPVTGENNIMPMGPCT